MANKWIKVERSEWNLSVEIVLFDKILLYAGRADSWGIEVDLSFYDRSLTFKILNLYTGIAILHSDKSLES
jgi:tRNA(Ser,Leu) C12 N-acetylase TAN1